MTITQFACRYCRAIAPGERKGVASVEFALYSIVFLILLAGTVDIGNLIFSEFQLDATVAAGAQYAVVNANNVNSTSGATLASSISAVVNNGHVSGDGWSNTVVVNNGPTTATSAGSPTSSGTASNADNCYCPTGSPGSWTWGSTVTCGAGCSGSGTAGKFVSITASRTYARFFPSWSFFSGNTLTRSAMVQVD